MTEVTKEDINMIDYFLKERGDIERWVKWEERKPFIQKEFPELVAAIDNQSIAIKTLGRVVDGVVGEIDSYPDG